MIKVFFGLLLFMGTASAAQLDDVQILDVKAAPAEVELKLHWASPGESTFFFVNVVNADPNSFDKLSHVIKKMMQQSQYKVTLDIPSFSAFPSGSYYQSPDIGFSGASLSAPSSAERSSIIVAPESSDHALTMAAQTLRLQRALMNPLIADTAAPSCM